MDELVLSVPGYDSEHGVVVPVEGGTVSVEIVNGSVEIFGDRAGLRDLARWCLALSDESAPSGAHIHLDPGTMPLSLDSTPLMLARDPRAD
ncbi:Imm32 family immunity protein [Micromonospora profundi]|uniref:Imm32 family immunity protein n=1 Tax=Micromonospora TaxID=1873 RepID=UPI00339F66DA